MISFLEGVPRQDRELCREIRGLKGRWSVSKGMLNPERQHVNATIQHPSGTKFCCPDFSATLPCCDHNDERHWRDLDRFQCKAFFTPSIPRVHCPEQGVKQIRVPRVEKGSRFTILFELFAILVRLGLKQSKV